MFRVLDFAPDGEVTVHDEPTTFSAVAPPPDGVVRWIDLAEQDGPQLDLLRERFDFHPLALEDCLHLDQRPKLEEFGDVLFVVTHGYSCTGPRVERLVPHELHSFLGRRYLVTVHADPIPELDSAFRRATQKGGLGARGADFLYYLVADAMADATFPILDKVAEELETLEEAVLARPSRAVLARIFALKHELAAMRRVLSPQRDVVLALSKADAPMSERNAAYLRDVYDHLARIVESIDAHRELLASAMEAYLSSVSNRTNEIMKYLTLMSALFLPLSFVVGFFGQNFDDLPYFPGWVHSRGLMFTMVALCVCVPTVMGTWFKLKRWL